MSTITEITDAPAFDKHISSLPTSTLLAISFHTAWAAPCTQMSLILRTLASSYPEQNPPTISFLTLDAEALPDISESYNVTAVPFLVLQRDGKVLDTISGSDAAKIREVVERHAGKGGNTGGVKLGLPPALETTPRENSEGTNHAKEAVNGNAAAPVVPETEDPTEELNRRLAELVKAAPVMLFMKGTPSAPQCGFSRTLVGLLRQKGVRYGFFNILADEEVRQGLKVFSNWPTFPQVYRHGELIGGLDIVKEELDTDPDFFAEYSVKGKGATAAAPEAQTT